MTTCYGGMGHTGKDRDLIFHVDITIERDIRGIDIGPNNNNKSTKSLVTTLAFRGSETDGHLSDLLDSHQPNLVILTREEDSL